MYPNLYYAFKDLFGIELNFLQFVNSFGFFVAIGFIVGAYVLSLELKRKSTLGLLKPTEVKVKVGEPASAFDLFTNFLLGFFLGFKIIGLFIMVKGLHADPQAFIFSSAGSWPAGIIVGLLFAGLKWQEKNKQKLAKPEERLIRIWPQDRVGDITIMALIFGLLGAKLFDIFENWSDFLLYPTEYIFSPAGLTFYGGLICAALAIWIYARKHGIGFWHLNDAAAPALMLSYAVGRIGCQVSGDGDWGIVNNTAKPFSWIPDWTWAYTYPNNVNEAGVKIAGCVGKYCHELPEAVYPTAFYETIVCAGLFAVLWMARKKLKVPGTIFALYLMLNGMERFFIEKIRVNVKFDFLGIQVTQAEIISTSLFLTGLIMWIILNKNVQKEK
jgi:phosphatidylglycerol---prolipoprotein diacylglyceryl transferase